MWILDKCMDRHIQPTYKCLIKGAVPAVLLFLKGKHERKIIHNLFSYPPSYILATARPFAWEVRFGGPGQVAPTRALPSLSRLLWSLTSMQVIANDGLGWQRECFFFQPNQQAALSNTKMKRFTVVSFYFMLCSSTRPAITVQLQFFIKKHLLARVKARRMTLLLFWHHISTNSK